VAKKHNPGFLQLVEAAKERIREATVAEVLAWRAEGKPFHLVDVREDHEFEHDRCAGALHLGKGILERDVETRLPNKEGLIVLYCGGGYRSALSADALQQMGYREVRSLAGGIRAWRAADAPLEG
tara:strand:- start:76 stop:450 length:375 start_codon:yes stop_codon:yes gene_type:complete